MAPEDEKPLPAPPWLVQGTLLPGKWLLHTALHCTSLYCNVPHSQHCIVRYTTVLYSTGLYFTALHCTTLHVHSTAVNILGGQKILVVLGGANKPGELCQLVYGPGSSAAVFKGKNQF